ITWLTEHLHNLYNLTPITDAVLQTACTLLEKHPLRSVDAIHLATVIILNQQLAAAEIPPLIFLSADTRLNEAALAEGLVVRDPNQPPPS
ncbi:MAG: type II toxin-antitoxin system VapC family toxin, partial [Chloroflexota bacterium]